MSQRLTRVSVAEFVVSGDGAGPYGITAGPDGALWFTLVHAGRIGLLPVDERGAEPTKTMPPPRRRRAPLQHHGLSWPSDDDLNSARGFLPQKDQAEFGPLPDFPETFAVKNVTR